MSASSSSGTRRTATTTLPFARPRRSSRASGASCRRSTRADEWRAKTNPLLALALGGSRSRADALDSEAARGEVHRGRVEVERGPEDVEPLVGEAVDVRGEVRQPSAGRE